MVAPQTVCVHFADFTSNWHIVHQGSVGPMVLKAGGKNPGTWTPIEMNRHGTWVERVPRSIESIRKELAAARAEADQLQQELDAALTAAGRRPTTGEDQPALFETDAQARLF